MNPTLADIAFVNGRIYPRADRDETSECLLVTDGRVAGYGERPSDLAAVARETVDLGGKTVMPGFLDVHNHHMLAGKRELFEIDFSPMATVEEILAAVSRYADSLTSGSTWVAGGSWGSGLFEQLDRVEAREALDRASKGRPVLVSDDSLHNRWANTRALELAGIGPDTPDPLGGHINRDAQGRVTGVLIEAAGAMAEQARARHDPFSETDMAASIEASIATLHRHGITAFQDAGASLQLMQALRGLDDAGRLHAWVVTSMVWNDFIFGFAPLGEGIIEHREETRSAHHRPDFIKIWLDGVPPARTAAFIEPYLPDPSGAVVSGATTMPAEELRTVLRSVAARGISAKIHCTGDRSVRDVLDAVEEIRAGGLTEVRFHVAHGQFVDEEDLPRFASLGVTADISPTLWFPGVIAEAIGQVRPAHELDRMQPNRELFDSGAVVAGGSDWPVDPSPNPWPGIYGLVTRQNPTGEFPGRLGPAQAITRAEALAVYTTNPARAMGLEGVCGSLEVGKSADLAVLTDDPYRCGEESLASMAVAETWFAGKRVYSAQ